MMTNVRVSDGTEMGVFVARPEAKGKVAGILVFQEAFGVNAHIRDVAGRFARLGYLAVAPELFHRTAPGFEGRYDDFSSVTPHMKALTNEGLEADVRAAFDLLHNDAACDGRIASVGFCMGGRVSFLANSILPLAAAVSFYGGGIAPGLLDRAPKQHGKLLMFWGGLDRHIGFEQRSEVRQALDRASKPYIHIVISFADHGFFCDARASFNAAAARDAWALTTSFLHGELAAPAD